MRKTEGQSHNFESSLGALEKIVRELERGELPLEKSLELFERGVRLSRECQERLQEAERRIEVLLGDGETRSLRAVGAPGETEFDGGAAGEDVEAEDDGSVF